MSNIQGFSKKVRCILQACIVFTPIFTACYWLNIEQMMNVNPTILGIPSGLLTLNSLSKQLGFCISLLPTVIVMTMFYQLVNVFKNYEKGEVFSQINTTAFKKLGYLMFGMAISNFICGGLMSCAMTFQNPPGYRTLILSISLPELMLIITGLVILGISYVMDEAHRLNEDTQLTV